MSFECSVAWHCGASMAGIKPASLAVCGEGSLGELAAFREQFLRKGIRTEILARKGSRITYLVFREEKLRAHLGEAENAAFLARCGYPDGLEAQLCTLKRRMRGGRFPHEVGIFLGYPAEDVLGYMRDPSACLLSGAWKVYAEPEKKRALFERYRRCSRGIVRRLTGGQKLADIFR